MDIGNVKRPAGATPIVRVPPAQPAEVRKEPVNTTTYGRQQVEAAAASIQEYVQAVRRSVNFSVEENSGRVVVKVTDADSGDVIRQIPSEEALQLAENLSEVRSLLFKAEA